MSDQTFEEMMEKFQSEPGTAPRPPKIDQKEFEKAQVEGKKNVEIIKDRLEKLEDLLKYNPHEARIEFFNIEYLLAQIPETLKTPKLKDRVKKLYEKIEKHETHKKISEFDKVKREHKEVQGDSETNISFADIEPEVGLEKSNEERFMETFEQDTAQQATEDKLKNGKQPKAAKDDDLKNLQMLEKEETKDVRKINSTESIEYLGKSANEVEETKKEEDTKIEPVISVVKPEKPPEPEKPEDLDVPIVETEEPSIEPEKPEVENGENPPIETDIPLFETSEMDKEIKPEEPKQISQPQPPKTPRVHIVHHKDLPLHKTGTNLIFGKDVKRGLSAGELYDNGMEYLNNREFEKAIQCFQGVLRRTPNNIAARIRIQEAQQKMKTI